MKTLIISASRLLLLAAGLGLGASQPAAAQSAARPQPVCVDQVGPFSYLVRVSNPSRVWSYIQLTNPKTNQTFFQRYSKGHTFGNRLNVQNLPDGEYAFQVKVGKDVYNYTLDIHSTHDRTARLGMVTTMALASSSQQRKP
ncbi:hypothetical protein EJV47_16320 [Hymenobacter gummosus]|uniref:DUF2846 domain-containing protein n=1 Tax=Hymenobacter gummosus TaxID=1776032 RepID=A0A431U0V8_9BACT|nr:hypothetical protein [Hymenobacter gummosus]RTQ48536.1 hypothetical protein EJV47_16320 [Hymenobacter gummosus]